MSDYLIRNNELDKELLLETISNNSLYNNNLSLSQFIHIFDNKVTCYKFYWLESILLLIAENPLKNAFTFEKVLFALNSLDTAKYFSTLTNKF